MPAQKIKIGRRCMPKASPATKSLSGGMLYITDNIEGGQIVHRNMSCAMTGRPYLVVAADKARRRFPTSPNGLTSGISFLA